MNNQFVIAVVLIGTFATSIYFNNEVRRGTVADMRTYTDVIPHDSNKKTNTYLVQLDGTVSKDKDDDSEDLKDDPKDELETLSIGELRKRMKEAIDDENYELASQLRDEIKKRKKGK